VCHEQWLKKHVPAKSCTLLHCALHRTQDEAAVRAATLTAERDDCKALLLATLQVGKKFSSTVPTTIQITHPQQ
jgi:hypothetical protein